MDRGGRGGGDGRGMAGFIIEGLTLRLKPAYDGLR